MEVIKAACVWTSKHIPDIYTNQAPDSLK